MFCIHLPENDPFFLLAAEEYLLKKTGMEIFMVWQCRDTVVVGKHQNTLGEINYRLVREKGIRVARRISGGGTVFHDQGNVNFVYIKNVAGPHEISFRKFTEPVTEALKTMGIPAVNSVHNDLLVNGKKISGNAEHVFRNRVLHHGTLLFNSDLAGLGNALRVVAGRYAGKAVQSNRSTVANISEFLPHPMNTGEFIRKLFNYQLSADPENQIYALRENEIREIRKLAQEKFATPEWQFGYSPAYTFYHSAPMDAKELEINLSVEKGKIFSAKVSGNYYHPDKAAKLELLLKGEYHLYEPVEQAHLKLGIPPDKDLIYSYF